MHSQIHTHPLNHRGERTYVFLQVSKLIIVNKKGAVHVIFHAYLKDIGFLIRTYADHHSKNIFSVRGTV